MGRGGQRGEQQNTSDRHALWITLPGDPCAGKRHGNEQYEHVSRRISRRRTEEANNYYTDIFCFMCDLNEYVYLTASRMFVFVTVTKKKSER